MLSSLPPAQPAMGFMRELSPLSAGWRPARARHVLSALLDRRIRQFPAHSGQVPIQRPQQWLCDLGAHQLSCAYQAGLVGQIGEAGLQVLAVGRLRPRWPLAW